MTPQSFLHTLLTAGRAATGYGSAVEARLLTLSDNASRVLEARYLRRDSARRVVETPDQLVERVARAVAQAELLLGDAAQARRWEEEFHSALAARVFLPNSPTLMNAGTPLGQLSACFVLPVDDTMEDIFEAVKQLAIVQRTGGGTGFSFSRLRPRGDVVASTGGEASGPVSFMRIFDCATEHIKQGGKRRGANMGVLRVDHPDILDFVGAKREESALRNFNLSVAVTDAFMAAARRGARYDLIHPRTGRSAGRPRADEVFEAIVTAAWEHGDPGLLFVDAINRDNPLPHLGPIDATNPCGEVPLLPYESCNLGSINLASLVRGSHGDCAVDWERLSAVARTAVRFLDDVIEVNRFPIPAIEARTRATRKIGLGVMGFAELLIRLGIPYDSGEAARMAQTLMEAVGAAARRASEELGAERGTFPAWKGSLYERRGLRMRNATVTAIAPTGTLSIIAGTSASIEPLFALAYRRSHVLAGETLPEVNPLLREALEQRGADADAIVDRVLEQGRLRDVAGVPPDVARLFVTALDIPPERHLAIQAAFQRHVDNSVSKTVNLPADATPGEVAALYRRAWELKLKGVTLYRYGSRSSQVLELGVDQAGYHFEHASACDPEECRV
ncbi:MAG TPA: adenosylcobalamin-dependent ribonucleoside-diphosphate reductase [Gemmatimonadales bacterium]|nr:adenosylcobalamin-dependent ribonucleoside-diphosphate reductase [Gemmatimonadales bacterium]